MHPSLRLSALRRQSASDIGAFIRSPFVGQLSLAHAKPDGGGGSGSPDATQGEDATPVGKEDVGSPADPAPGDNTYSEANTLQCGDDLRTARATGVHDGEEQTCLENGASALTAGDIDSAELIRGLLAELNESNKSMDEGAETFETTEGNTYRGFRCTAAGSGTRTGILAHSLEEPDKAGLEEPLQQCNWESVIDVRTEPAIRSRPFICQQSTFQCAMIPIAEKMPIGPNDTGIGRVGLQAVKQELRIRAALPDAMMPSSGYRAGTGGMATYPMRQ